MEKYILNIYLTRFLKIKDNVLFFRKIISKQLVFLYSLKVFTKISKEVQIFRKFSIYPFFEL